MKKSKLIGGIAGIGALAGGIGGMLYLFRKTIQKEGNLQKRYKSYYELTNQWLNNQNEQKEMEAYFSENGLKKIAIYGMGTLGELFYKEIKKSGVEVVYFVDKNAETPYYAMDHIPVVNIEEIENQPEVDAMIITPVYDFDEICKELERAGAADRALISLEDIVYGI